jgi:hypothetical protein
LTETGKENRPSATRTAPGSPGPTARFAPSSPIRATRAGRSGTSNKPTAAVVRQAAGQLRLLASQVREARRQAETHVDWYAGLKRDLRRAERERAEKDLAKAEAAVAGLRELLARRPEPPEDPAQRVRRLS